MGKTLIERLAAVPSVGTDYRPYAVSPDGQTVAFQWYHDGDWRSFLMDLGGGEPVRVGGLDDPCWCPLFSPDGRSLYFAKADRGSECFDVYRYDIASGALENLLPDTPDFSPLPDFHLSPDDARIAMTASHGAGYSVAVMPARVSPGGAAVTHLSDHPYTESSPQWSPNGSRLAVAAGTRGQDTPCSPSMPRPERAPSLAAPMSSSRDTPTGHPTAAGSRSPADPASTRGSVSTSSPAAR